MIYQGAALCLGDHVNTDALHPSEFYSLDPERVRAGFLGAVPGRQGAGVGVHGPRVLVAGENLGGGSSRETTVTALKLAGVQAVVAVSVARIFFRNAMNLGVPARRVADPAAIREILEGDPLQLEDDVLRNLRTGRALGLVPLDPHERRVLAAGGLLPWLSA